MNKCLLFEIKNLHIAITKKMCNIMKENKYINPPSPLQAKILDYLIKHSNEEVYQKDLEEVFNVSRATISETLQTMEKNEIVERIVSTKDARVKQIKLTENSKKRYKEMQKNIKIINKNLVENISDEELEIFSSVIQKMIKNMNLNKEEKC